MMKSRFVHITLAALLAMVVPGRCLAADDPAPESPLIDSNEVSPDEVAATVNGEPVTLGAVNEAMKGVLQGRSLNPATLPLLQAEVLSQLIDRELLTQMLAKSGKAAPDTEITQAFDQVKRQAEEKKVDLAKSLADRGLTEEQFREQLAWQINWAKFLQTALTGSVMRKYFEAHKRHFDGTELRVSHILMRPDSAGSPAETERLTKMAEKLRGHIESGKLTFEEAAKKYSAGPSRHKGGDLGMIPRNGLMLEQFTAAAFSLEKGKISQPVVTPYGVHLIKVTDEKPGRKIWSEVKEAIKGPATQAIFEKLAAAEREKAKIDYTGKCPHFKPGTRTLATE